MYRKTETTNIKRYITNHKNYDYGNGIKCEVDYVYCNTKTYCLSATGINKLQKYLNRNKDLKQIIVVNNIEITRPQRTSHMMPEYFRPADNNLLFNDVNYDNSFIFAIYDWENSYTEEEIQQALKSLPTKSTIIRLKKEEK